MLPELTKTLINSLVESAAAVMEDIVAGKTGGVVIGATGAPGTGKTLTAEVYSEHIKRPLYNVQCSQLGTNEVQLEKKLNVVLARASRWGAILLIDEADVYVRARGDDIQQNAIVGVFLRLLERYRGVLFLTSNRATEIDDAILSRMIAHVRYELPDAVALAKIWKVLSENYAVSLSDAEIAELVKEFPRASGRNVKTLLKLATILAKKQAPTVVTFVEAAKYIDFPT